MNLYYQDPAVTLYNGDCRCMSELPDESVQMAVTSPPYWGLRRYSGLPDLVWSGKEDCQHRWEDVKPPRMATPGDRPSAKSLIAIKRTNNENRPMGITNTCSLCGAWKGQLGLEPSPELFISHLIQIFREVKRVLRKDGVCFVNCGDSYYNDTRGGIRPPSKSSIVKDSRYDEPIRVAGQSKVKQHLLTTCPVCLIDTYAEKCCGIDLTYPLNTSNNLKPKDLCLIPFRLAIALQEDGWWVRSVIIWSKNNPMPESVRDRPTESHEYILMLTKSARYYWDQEAVREAYTKPLDRWGGEELVANGYSTWDEGTGQLAYRNRSMRPNPNGRNLRSVWEFSTQSYKEAHFATYPEELVRRCVLAATPEAGCCPKCGKPWVRVVERTVNAPTPARIYTADTPGVTNGIGSFTLGQTEKLSIKTLGWKAQCKCGLPQSENIGSIVLDPFAGSCTSLSVAKRLGRRAIGYELSKQYCALGVKRIETETAPMRLE